MKEIRQMTQEVIPQGEQAPAFNCPAFEIGICPEILKLITERDELQSELARLFAKELAEKKRKKG